MNKSEQNSTISPQQEKAVYSLLAGASVQATADAISVSRTTIYKWFDNPEFMAFWNKRRVTLRELHEERLDEAVSEALAVLINSLRSEAPDPQLAIRVLQGAGLLNGKKGRIGSTDPQQIQAAQDQQKMFSELWSQLVPTAKEGGSAPRPIE